jgi:hypothetical protein
VAQVIGRTTDYVKNPEKTNGGEYISAYECDTLIADSEFQFSKRKYEHITGRNRGTQNVLAYHLRQSFKPGEVTPEEANKSGYELAMRLTKSKNAFLVCTHVDKAHIHSHIIIDSVNLDRTKKFRNFKNSSFAIRKLSDQICLEHGLPVIENPKPSRGHYGTWEKAQIELKSTEKLNLLIDIQQKMREGYGEGFKHYATLQNLKDSAKTLIFLQENKLTDYDKLKTKANETSQIFDDLSVKIKQGDTRMKEIAELQKNISNYSRTRKIYAQYKKSGWSKKFHSGHEPAIIIHKAAKKFFDGLGMQKFPPMQSLKEEYAMLSSKHKNSIRNINRRKKI